MGSPGGKHCKSLQRNVGRGAVSPFKSSVFHGKVRHSMPRDSAFNGETTPRHTILCSDSQCFSPDDPKILYAKHKYPITGKSFIPYMRVLTAHCF